MERKYPTRGKKVDYFAKQPTYDVTFESLRTGFDNFAAEVSKEGDGDGTCKAKLRVPDFDLEIEGSTGNGNGHAEMDALTQLLKGSSKGDIRFFKGYLARETTVSCTAKPCCCRCAAVLGLLGIKPAADGTYKNPSGMGSTQWSVNEDLAKAIFEIAGVDVRKFANYSNVSGK